MYTSLSCTQFTNDVDKVNILNNFFSTVFTKEDLDHLPTPEEIVFPDIDPLQITTNGVTILLKDLKPHKASGPDGIPSCLLKETANTIVPAVTLIYCIGLHYSSRLSLKTGRKPYLQKRTLQNYRPILPTCISCKLFEHIFTHIQAFGDPQHTM